MSLPQGVMPWLVGLPPSDLVWDTAPAGDTVAPASPIESVHSDPSGTQRSGRPSGSYDTVAMRAQSSSPNRQPTLEWKRRLVRGQLGYGDRTDLFGPSGLENMFVRPRDADTPSQKKQQNKVAGKPKITTTAPVAPAIGGGDIASPRSSTGSSIEEMFSEIIGKADRHHNKILAFKEHQDQVNKEEKLKLDALLEHFEKEKTAASKLTDLTQKTHEVEERAHKAKSEMRRMRSSSDENEHYLKQAMADFRKAKSESDHWEEKYENLKAEVDCMKTEGSYSYEGAEEDEGDMTEDFPAEDIFENTQEDIEGDIKHNNKEDTEEDIEGVGGIEDDIEDHIEDDNDKEDIAPSEGEGSFRVKPTMQYLKQTQSGADRDDEARMPSNNHLAPPVPEHLEGLNSRTITDSELEDLTPVFISKRTSSNGKVTFNAIRKNIIKQRKDVDKTDTSQRAREIDLAVGNESSEHDASQQNIETAGSEVERTRKLAAAIGIDSSGNEPSYQNIGTPGYMGVRHVSGFTDCPDVETDEPVQPKTHASDSADLDFSEPPQNESSELAAAHHRKAHESGSIRTITNWPSPPKVTISDADKESQATVLAESKRPPTSPFRSPTPKRRRTLHDSELQSVTEANLSYHSQLQSVIGSPKAIGISPADVKTNAEQSILARRKMGSPRKATPSQGPATRDYINEAKKVIELLRGNHPTSSPLSGIAESEEAGENEEPAESFYNTHKSSENMRTLGPQAVAHLIGGEVKGMTFDQDKNCWVRSKSSEYKQFLGPRDALSSDDDPFREISDLTVERSVRRHDGEVRIQVPARTSSLAPKRAPSHEEEANTVVHHEYNDNSQRNDTPLPFESSVIHSPKLPGDDDTLAHYDEEHDSDANWVVEGATEESAPKEPADTTKSSAVPSLPSHFAFPSPPSHRIPSKAANWSRSHLNASRENNRENDRENTNSAEATQTEPAKADATQAEASAVAAAEGDWTKDPTSPEVVDYSEMDARKAGDSEYLYGPFPQPPKSARLAMSDRQRAQERAAKTAEETPAATAKEPAVKVAKARSSKAARVSSVQITNLEVAETPSPEMAKVPSFQITKAPSDEMATKQSAGIGKVPSVQATESPSLPLAPVSSYEARKLHLADIDNTFYMSDLPDFTINDIDRQTASEEALRIRLANYATAEVNDPYAIARAALVKAVTDDYEHEMHWETLTTLSISNKGLKSLHTLDSQCPRVEKLDISENVLTQLGGIPPFVRQLDLRSNKLSSLTSWTHLLHVQYLDISNNAIDSLDGLGHLIHLRELNVDNNCITSLDGLANLDGLIKLSAKRNRLTKVDFAHYKTDRLIDLDLSNNPNITTINKLEALTSLRTLKLEGSRLPNGLLVSIDMPSLKHLSLPRCSIATLDVSNFSKLRALNVDNNRLSHVEGLSTLKKLQEISMAEQTLPHDKFVDILENPLEAHEVILAKNTLPKLNMKHNLMSVKYLDLRDTGLRELPKDFAHRFRNLRILLLDNNRIQDIRALAPCHLLDTLSVRHCRLFSMRKNLVGLQTMPKLKDLDLRGNPLTQRLYGDSAVTDEVWHSKLDKNQDFRRRAYECLVAFSIDYKEGFTLDGLAFDASREKHRGLIWKQMHDIGVIGEVE